MLDTIEWERLIILELYDEHKYICRERRANLSPIAIQLFDSKTRWGVFDPIVKTIFISREAIRRYSWHQVLGVFRHEMAHQWVNEHHPETDQTAHGELFHQACQILGVPDSFVKSGADLQENTLDWRTEKRDADVEKIIEKVQKLLALAGSSNEHEALLAMERVREMYAKYNLELSAKKMKSQFVHHVISYGKKRVQLWEKKTASILAEHFFVKVITIQQFDPVSLQKHQAFEIIGASENVLMAEHVYFFLLNQMDYYIERLTNDAKLTSIEKKSFRMGLLNGFSKKLKKATVSCAGATSMDENFSSLTIVGQALRVFNEDLEIDKYINRIYPRLRNLRFSSYRIDPLTFNAGQKIGGNIHLNKPVTSSSNFTGKLLEFK